MTAKKNTLSIAGSITSVIQVFLFMRFRVFPAVAGPGDAVVYGCHIKGYMLFSSSAWAKYKEAFQIQAAMNPLLQ